MLYHRDDVARKGYQQFPFVRNPASRLPSILVKSRCRKLKMEMGKILKKFKKKMLLQQ
jgi:hypothetical protein